MTAASSLTELQYYIPLHIPLLLTFGDLVRSGCGGPQLQTLKMSAL